MGFFCIGVNFKFIGKVFVGFYYLIELGDVFILLVFINYEFDYVFWFYYFFFMYM